MLVDMMPVRVFSNALFLVKTPSPLVWMCAPISLAFSTFASTCGCPPLVTSIPTCRMTDWQHNAPLGGSRAPFNGGEGSRGDGWVPPPPAPRGAELLKGGLGAGS